MITIGPCCVFSSLDSVAARVWRICEKWKRSCALHEVFRGVKHLGVHRVDGGGVDCEDAVHIDGDSGYLPFAHEEVQVIHQLLCPANGEGRNEHLWSAFSFTVPDAEER